MSLDRAEIPHNQSANSSIFSDYRSFAYSALASSRRDARLRFALKTGESLRIAGHIFGQEFECDKTVQPRVLRLINHPHAPAPQLLDNAVVRDGLANHWRESYGCETGKSTTRREEGRRGRKRAPNRKRKLP
jgi:hypothetical protein